MATVDDKRPDAWQVVGHDWAVKYLSNQPTPHHAYLFAGPRHVGKSTLVRDYARLLFCTSRNRPCGYCRHCQLLADGAHPDFIVVAPMESDPEKAREGQSIKVDRDAGKMYVNQAEAIVTAASLRPMEARYKLFHVQDAERVTGDAFFNKLLKTIEEPPSHVVICITVSDRSEILSTVASRCQNIALQPVDRSIVQRALTERWGVEAEKASLLARLANGRLGWAVEESRKKSMWEERETLLQELWALVRGDAAQRLAASEQMAKKKDARLFATLETWQGWWRDVLVVQAGAPQGVINIDKQDELQRQAQSVPASEVQSYLSKIDEVVAALRHTVNARLALDALLLRMPQIAR
jgi:DNA polymerase-3 subunit delta'